MSNKPHQGANLTMHVMEFVQQTDRSGESYNWAVLWVAGVNDLSNSLPPVPFPYRYASASLHVGQSGSRCYVLVTFCRSSRHIC